jgi:hypothetical protein
MGVGAMLMEHWLYTPANDNPEHGIHDVANYEVTRPGLNRYYVNNADFREWRKKYGKGFGGDFMVFSDIKVFDTNDSFQFP